MPLFRKVWHYPKKILTKTCMVIAIISKIVFSDGSFPRKKISGQDLALNVELVLGLRLGLSEKIEPEID